MRWLVVAVVCSIACSTACKGKQAPAPKRDDAAPAPADAALPDAALDAAPVDAATLATAITSDGVGPITAAVASEDEFSKALPRFKISSQHRDAEDYSYEEVSAHRDGKLVLRAVITGNRLFKVVVVDPLFATEAGVTTGMTVADAARKIKDLQCVYHTYDPAADAERVERSLRCESASLARVMFEIDHQKFKGGEGKVSSKAIGERKIVEIVWLAEGE